MDQELQMLINTLYGNKLNEKQLSNIIQMWNSNQNGYQDNMRKQAFAKMPAGTNKINPVAAQKVMNQTVGTTPKLGQSSFTFDKSQGRAANDMSAIADFKQAFRQARQGGHKTFFWKKTKANPSGMFSTELASSQTSLPEDNPVEELQVPITQIQADMSKTNLPIFTGKYPETQSVDNNLFQPVANQIENPYYFPESFKNNYVFDKKQAETEDWKKTGHSRPTIVNPGSPMPFMRQSFADGGKIDNIINQIINAIIQGDPKVKEVFTQLGPEGEAQIKEIIKNKAAKGDQAAAQADAILNKQAQVAKLGTKLNYIQKLKGICPEGTEKIYLKNGGCMCAQKAQKGSNGIEKNDTIHHNKQVYDLTGKHKQFKKLTNKDYRNLPTKKQASVDNKDMMRAKDAEKKSCGGKTKNK